MSEAAGQPRATKTARLVLALASFFVIAFLVQEVPRVLFPWDLRQFSESEFLTDMMKLTAGQGTYTSPQDGNSFIYAPGLEWITYAILRPFGAQLDIRACRFVCTLLGLAYGATAGTIGARLVRSMDPTIRTRSVRALTTIAATLAVFKSFTADACHPDNLYGLHAMLTIVLLANAIESKTFRSGLVLVVFASLGVLAKQTALLGFFGATATLLWVVRKEWPLARLAIASLVGGACTALALYGVFHGWGKYWAWQLPSHQGVELERVHRLAAHVFEFPHRFVLFFTVAPSALFVFHQCGSRGKALLASWAIIGFTEVMPSLVSYFKVAGYWNNLTILDVWASIPVCAMIAWGVFAKREDRAPMVRAAIGGFALTFIVTLVPTRSMPTPGQYDFGHKIDAAIAKDKAEGKRPLVTAGAATLIHNGMTDVPLDRGISLLERNGAGMTDFDDMEKRLDAHYYDRVYLFDTPPCPPGMLRSLDKNYHEVGVIGGDGSQWLDEDRLGFMGMMRNGAKILEPKK